MTSVCLKGKRKLQAWLECSREKEGAGNEVRETGNAGFPRALYHI